LHLVGHHLNHTEDARTHERQVLIRVWRMV